MGTELDIQPIQFPVCELLSLLDAVLYRVAPHSPTLRDGAELNLRPAEAHDRRHVLIRPSRWSPDGMIWCRLIFHEPVRGTPNPNAWEIMDFAVRAPHITVSDTGDSLLVWCNYTGILARPFEPALTEETEGPSVELMEKALHLHAHAVANHARPFIH